MKVLIINGSPRVDGNTTIASSQYWNSAHGREKYGLPKTEEHQWTHLI